MWTNKGEQQELENVNRGREARLRNMLAERKGHQTQSYKPTCCNQFSSKGSLGCPKVDGYLIAPTKQPKSLKPMGT